MSLTLILIIVTVLISWPAFSNQEMFVKLMHYPYGELRSKEYYRFLTSVFLHGSTMHLFINMFVLYQFGTGVEGYFVIQFGEGLGRTYYLLLYLLSGIFGDIPTYFKHKNNQMFSSVGASGAVSGIMLAFVIFNPWSMLLLFSSSPCLLLLQRYCTLFILRGPVTKAATASTTKLTSGGLFSDSGLQLPSNRGFFLLFWTNSSVDFLFDQIRRIINLATSKKEPACFSSFPKGYSFSSSR